MEGFLNKISNSNIRLVTIVENNNDEFEAVVDSYFLNPVDFENILEFGKEVFGEDCKFYFSSAGEYNIAFGVMTKKKWKKTK